MGVLRCAASQVGKWALGTLPRRFRQGVAVTSGQVSPYASSWTEANERSRTAAGSLWVVLGDSTAQGIGASTYEHGYVGLVRTELERGGGRWRVLNLSHSGARVADVLADQLPLLAAVAPPPDLVTCLIGGNDLLHTRAPAALAGFQALISALPAEAVIGTVPQGLAAHKARRINALIRADAADHGLRVADVWAWTGRPWGGKYAEDFFHPNNLGYRSWAAAVTEALALPVPGP